MPWTQPGSLVDRQPCRIGDICTEPEGPSQAPCAAPTARCRITTNLLYTDTNCERGKVACCIHLEQDNTGLLLARLPPGSLQISRFHAAHDVVLQGHTTQASEKFSR